MLEFVSYGTSMDFTRPRGNELEFTDIVLLDGLYCASVFGPACALLREHRAAKAVR